MVLLVHRIGDVHSQRISPGSVEVGFWVEYRLRSVVRRPCEEGNIWVAIHGPMLYNHISSAQERVGASTSRTIDLERQRTSGIDGLGHIRESKKGDLCSHREESPCDSHRRPGILN